MLGYVDEVNVELDVTVVEVVVGAAPKTSVLLAMLVKGSKLLRPVSVPSKKSPIPQPSKKVWKNLFNYPSCVKFSKNPSNFVSKLPSKALFQPFMH